MAGTTKIEKPKHEASIKLSGIKWRRFDYCAKIKKFLQKKWLLIHFNGDFDASSAKREKQSVYLI